MDMRKTVSGRSLLLGVLAIVVCAGPTLAQTLPGRYFRLMEAGTARVEARLNAETNASLESLESKGERHFPYAILPPAVLYAKQHAQNPHYKDPKMLALAIRIGDLLATEDEKGTFEPRGDSDWDTSMWLEAYRVLENDLGDERRARWKKAIERNVALVLEDARERLDFPWYNTPYIGTSPNHYAQYAGNLLIAGRVFGNKEWEDLGAAILKRFATVEQTPDGYWGEHSRNGPTTGYDYLTMSQVAIYWEFTKDPAAMEALRRSTDFHKYFTYPDGTPVEVINDRNRRWSVSAWGTFGFSHFPDGRAYAEFLASFFEPETVSLNDVGRIAQDALYYHEGPVSDTPMTQQRFAHRLSIPAGIRKAGPWVVCLSGIVDTSAPLNRFYLDRQGHLSVFHEKLGLIITGANSKRQPELATFSEKFPDFTANIPLSGRLQMGEAQDRLSLGYNTFWADLLAPEPSGDGVKLRFVINGRGRPAEDLRINLQLVLKPGETLETGAGRKFKLSEEKIELSPEDLGGSISHNGWTMKLDPDASLIWPVYPQNPYADAPETQLRYAVGRLTIPLHLKERSGHYVRPNEKQVELEINTVRP
ncbi:MAG: hypothetical protein WD733_18200 [Bryobacterales bacterium]